MPGGGKLLVPPGYGNFPIPHADTFSTKVNLTARTWYNPDEAYRNNRVQQRAMRMDPVCMEPLRQRQLATALLEWSIQPEDKGDPKQRQVCEELTRWFRKIPHFIKLRLCLLEAIWYGKYAAAIDYDWSDDCTRLMLSRWRPLHGDKLRFEQETGKLGSARRISSGSKGGSNLSPIDWRYTEEFPIEIFDCNEREAIALHQHEVEDGDYWDWCFAGAVDGIGLRTRVYWPWYMKQQGLQWLMDFLQRSGVGVKIWYFEKGNARDEAEVSKIAQKYSNEMVILAPWPIGQEKPSPVLEFKEPGMGGATLIKEILDDYFGDQIHRMIVGSTLMSKTGATGLGGNVAEKHERTTMNLSEFDSINLDETITREILWVAARYNYPGIGWQPTFQSAFREQDPAALLEAAEKFQAMGGEVGENQIREVIGLSAPDDSDRILEPVTRDVPGAFGGPGGPGGGENGGAKSMFDNTSGREGEQTPGGAGSEEYAGTVRYAAFREEDHPRADDGEFTAGAGGGGMTDTDAKAFENRAVGKTKKWIKDNPAAKDPKWKEYYEWTEKKRLADNEANRLKQEKAKADAVAEREQKTKTEAATPEGAARQEQWKPAEQVLKALDESHGREIAKNVAGDLREALARGKEEFDYELARAKHFAETGKYWDIHLGGEPNGKWVNLSGDTFSIKDELKSKLGATFNGYDKTWTIARDKISQLPDILRGASVPAGTVRYAAFREVRLRKAPRGSRTRAQKP